MCWFRMCSWAFSVPSPPFHCTTFYKKKINFLFTLHYWSSAQDFYPQEKWFSYLGANDVGGTVGELLPGLGVAAVAVAATRGGAHLVPMAPVLRHL